MTALFSDGEGCAVGDCVVLMLIWRHEVCSIGSGAAPNTNVEEYW